MDFLSNRRIDLGSKKYLTHSVSTKSLSREASRTRLSHKARVLRTSQSRKTILADGIRSPILSPIPPDFPKQAPLTKRSLKPKSRSSRPSPDTFFRDLKLPKLSSPELRSSRDIKTDRLSAPLSSKHSTETNTNLHPKRRVQSMFTQDQPEIKSNVVNVVMRCAYKSRVGFVNNRNKKHNQDAFIIHPYLKKVKGQYLFAVCDGHGVHGHDVSEFIKEFLVRNIEESIPDTNIDMDTLISALRTGVLTTNLQLSESGINVGFSGSTLNAILIRSSLVLCANVGDSRSVVAKKRGDSWHAISLSRDHKPDLPSEAARILSNNGRVESYFDQNGMSVGPARVWLANQQIPGLAMSRSLGDVVASSVGVIADPEIQVYELTYEDKFIIIASDGIWEFISSEEAVCMVSSLWQSGNAESCCDKLVKEATIRWQKEDENIDDMTVIVIFLNVQRF